VRIASVGPRGDVARLASAKGASLWQRLVLRNLFFLSPSPQANVELLKLGCRPEIVYPITNGVDIERFKPLSDAEFQGGAAPSTPPGVDRGQTIAYVGRLEAVKNPLAVLRAWRLLKRPANFQLLIAGDGPLLESLQAYCRQQGLGNVRFLGHCDDVLAVYRQAVTFVQPSPHEGCSNSLLEAMASGLCPVVSRVPGNTEVIRDGVNGLVVTLDDDQQMAAALARTLDDRELRARLSTAAREHVIKHHDLEQIAAEYLTIFDHLAKSEPILLPGRRATAPDGHLYE
jgi:glycosyltransferase involved in cell wall biosynthesis